VGSVFHILKSILVKSIPASLSLAGLSLIGRLLSFLEDSTARKTFPHTHSAFSELIRARAVAEGVDDKEVTKAIGDAWGRLRRDGIVPWAIARFLCSQPAFEDKSVEYIVLTLTAASWKMLWNLYFAADAPSEWGAKGSKATKLCVRAIVNNPFQAKDKAGAIVKEYEAMIEWYNGALHSLPTRSFIFTFFTPNARAAMHRCIDARRSEDQDEVIQVFGREAAGGGGG
jgi:hypothetical protein